MKTYPLGSPRNDSTVVSLCKWGSEEEEDVTPPVEINGHKAFVGKQDYPIKDSSLFTRVNEPELLDSKLIISMTKDPCINDATIKDHPSQLFQ